MGSEVLLDPDLLLLQGPRNQVKSDGRFDHLGVIDRGQGLGIGSLDGTDVHTHTLVGVNWKKVALRTNMAIRTKRCVPS